MSDYHATMDAGVQARPLKDSVRSFERQVIHEALRQHGDDKRVVAKLLGISLSSLYRKISELSTEDEGRAFQSGGMTGMDERAVHH